MDDGGDGADGGLLAALSSSARNYLYRTDLCGSLLLATCGNVSEKGPEGLEYK